MRFRECNHLSAEVYVHVLTHCRASLFILGFYCNNPDLSHHKCTQMIKCMTAMHLVYAEDQNKESDTGINSN
jgi:hypothetical protein